MNLSNLNRQKEQRKHVNESVAEKDRVEAALPVIKGKIEIGLFSTRIRRRANAFAASCAQIWIQAGEKNRIQTRQYRKLQVPDGKDIENRS